MKTEPEIKHAGDCFKCGHICDNQCPACGLLYCDYCINDHDCDEGDPGMNVDKWLERQREQIVGKS